MLRSVPDVDAQPTVIVEPWVVLEVIADPVPDQPPPPYRFVLGYDASRASGRVSTLIVDQDRQNKWVRTKSGRIYRLSGPPALDADAWYVWTRKAGSVRFRDVSAEFWPGYVDGSAKLVETGKNAAEDALRRQGFKVVGWLPDDGGDEPGPPLRSVH